MDLILVIPSDVVDSSSSLERIGSTLFLFVRRCLLVATRPSTSKFSPSSIRATASNVIESLGGGVSGILREEWVSVLLVAPRSNVPLNGSKLILSRFPGVDFAELVVLIQLLHARAGDNTRHRLALLIV